MNILAIGAHPDDIELGCGGLLLKATKQGHNSYMYTLTHGEASGDPHLRIDELKRSSKIIGTKALWIDSFEDTKLSVSDKLEQLRHCNLYKISLLTCMNQFLTLPRI